MPSFPVLALGGLPINHEMQPANVHAGKRSFFINPERSGGLKPWPNGQITWCLDGVEPDQALTDLFDPAWGKWNSIIGGLQRAKLSINGDGKCNDDNGNFLHLYLTNEQRAATTLGYKRPGHDDRGNPNQLMRFDRSNTWGTGDSASNLAHELGHAFGLWHEHQRWYAWHSDRMADPPRTDPFVKLNCKNLKDYDQFASQYSLEIMDQLCTSVYFAQARGFSAADFTSYSEVTTNH